VEVGVIREAARTIPVKRHPVGDRRNPPPHRETDNYEQSRLHPTRTYTTRQPRVQANSTSISSPRVPRSAAGFISDLWNRERTSPGVGALALLRGIAHFQKRTARRSRPPSLIPGGSNVAARTTTHRKVHHDRCSISWEDASGCVEVRRRRGRSRIS